MSTMGPEHIVEAALFSAGRPLAIDEIMQETGLKRPEVEKAVKALQKAYVERDTVLEIGKAGVKWGMQVRRQAAEPAARFAPMEIPKKTLKTLALIAYHQPLKQSELVDMIGSKAYDHVHELREKGLVMARQDGVTKLLSTTAAFPEYFGLDAEDTEGVRAAVAKLVGLPPPERKKKERDLSTFAPSQEAEEAPPGSAPQGLPEPSQAPEAQEQPPSA